MGESKGNVKVDFVDKIMSTLERANIFVEVSRNRLRIADQLDDEASNDHRGDGHDHVDDSSLSLEEAEEGPKESYESYENDNGPDDDDIIDDETMRRQKDPFHVKYGYNTSVLTGDFVLGLILAISS